MAKCPYCKAPITLKSLKKEKRGLGLFKQEIMYCCPKCESVLGLSRGKWTG